MIQVKRLLIAPPVSFLFALLSLVSLAYGELPGDQERPQSEYSAVLTRIEKKPTGALADPLNVGPWVLQSSRIEPALLYGIFNPFGPTFSSITLVGDEGGSRLLIVHTMLNPFEQQYQIIGSLIADKAPPVFLDTDLIRV